MSKSHKNSEKVSPTAYATGYFWFRHGLSHPALATPQGKRLDRGFRLMIAGVRRISGVHFDAMMLARHKGIDACLTRAIEEGRVRQVIEIAAGLSPRGWSFMQRYGDKLTYIETDLPQMAALKRRLLSDAGLLGKKHRIVELDALADDGENSLAAIACTLNPKLGTAIITEGLMNYLDPAAARGVWSRIAETLKRFPQGFYFSDAYLRSEQRSLGMLAFGLILSAFVRGRMYVHYRKTTEAISLMRGCGFSSAALHAPRDLPETRAIARTPGAGRVRVLEARS